MPSIDDSIAMGFIPESSVGTYKPSGNGGPGAEGFGRTELHDSYLDKATTGNPVPVIVKDNASDVASFVKEEQDTTQVYVTEVKKDSNGKITEVLLSRNDANGNMTVVDWCSRSSISCGSLADMQVQVDGKLPVQDDPDTTPTETESETEKSYVFFDPFGKEDNGDGFVDVDRALGVQYDVARYIGKYKRDKQEHNEKHVNCTPVSKVDTSSVTFEHPDNANLIVNRGGLDGTVA